MLMPKIIATHSGRFHSDEVFGVALLKMIFSDAEVIRTRDMEKIWSADVVLDVGGIYDETKDRFDHHQFGGAGKRENEIPYASFGLVWKKYGKKVCGNDEVGDLVEKNLVMPIDAMDNGIDLVSSVNKGAFPVFLQDIVFWFTSTWQERERGSDEGFFEMIPLAQKIIERAIVHSNAEIEGNDAVENAYKKADDKRIIVLDDRYSYRSLYKYNEPVFVVMPDSQPEQWKLQAVELDDTTYRIRKKLPQDWAGKRDVDLQKETGVEDAIFCHNACFMAVSKSKEGALKLAQLAIEF